jgi:hypothetical protein
MFNSEITDKDYIWNRLQEPARPASSHPAYLLLLAALDTGWYVLNPVHLNPSPDSEGHLIYHILIHRPPTPDIRILTIPAGPLIDRFLREENYQITPGNFAFITGQSLYLS